MKRVRVVTDGTIAGTRVTDDDTGEWLEAKVSVGVFMGADGRWRAKVVVFEVVFPDDWKLGGDE